ncbi:immunity protein Imm1 of predicted polymorphic toxin system [Prauserella shujinwangii]|uniref:Immunity protein Imm1 of predicted polymorphic toxin system n=1 Tax=Prauserella shujinwangii TaxID=1453103 RepID=A0A2T0M281_9PSEU|nr:Imm1 family immunity protein [Prauserella shujinwangii]PRX50863.1 immunity protein Imm1 of predicted polymorphic toxin system [Prauserella shujinwangii]
MDLAAAEDVRTFVAMLAHGQVGGAILTHTGRPRVETLIPDDANPGERLTMPDHSVIVGVRGDRGAISCRGADGHGAESVQLYSHGEEPDHRVLYETDEFPPDCELPVNVITQTLIEFLETAKRPLTIGWQSALDSALP